MTSHLHVVAGDGAASLVRGALGRLGMTDEVVGLRDPLNVGPLWDIETGGAARAEFWRAVRPSGDDSPTDEARAWSNILAAGTVTVWSGQHPMEHLLRLRLAARLPRHTRLLQVVLPARGRTHLAPFRDAIDLSTADALAQLLPTRTTVSDVDAMHATWSNLTASRSIFRELDRGRVVELAEDAYDDRIISCCRTGWERTLRVVASVLADAPIGDLVIAWRVRELLQSGRLIGRGAGPFGAAQIRGAP